MYIGACVNQAAGMSYRQLRRRIRPARVVTVVPRIKEDWASTALRMLENYSITWGGCGDVLVPVDAESEWHPAFWPIVELFDADVWAGYTVTRRGQQLANPTGFKERLNKDARNLARKNTFGVAQARQMLTAEHMMTSALGAVELSSDCKSAILSRTGPPLELDDLRLTSFRADGGPGHNLVDVSNLEPLPRSLRVIDGSTLPTSIQVLLAMRFGGLAPTQERRLADAGVEVRRIPVAESDLDYMLRLAWLGDGADIHRRTLMAMQEEGAEPNPLLEEELLSSTPMALSALGLSRYNRWHPAQDEAATVIVVGDHFDDFAYALALDRSGVRALWLPHELAISKGGLGPVVRNALTASLALERRPEAGAVVLVSLSLDVAAVRRVAKGLGSTVWGAHVAFDPDREVSLPPHRVPAWLDPECFDEALEEPFNADVMARGLPSALPSKIRAADPLKLSWWTEVNDYSHVLPGKAALNSLIIEDSRPWRPLARCGRDGLAFFSQQRGFIAAGTSLQQMVERPRLRFPTAEAVFWHLFQGAGFTAQESPAGRFRRLTTELWGSFSALADDLASEDRLRLLRAWLSETRSGDDPGVFTSARRRYLSFEDATVASGMEQTELRHFMDSLVVRGVLRRGYVLKCSHCLHFDWYTLGSIDQSFSCSRCATANDLTRSSWRGQDPEPTPYYDLAEVVLQALKGNAEVPVRALARLRDGARSFLEVTEMELAREDGTKLELDLLAIVDGRLVIGEAKTGNRIAGSSAQERTWLAKLARTVAAIGAHEVVFATASDAWSDATLVNIKTAFERVDPPVEVRTLTSC